MVGPARSVVVVIGIARCPICKNEERCIAGIATIKTLSLVARSVATKVSEACPDADWRLIFALARFAGLRWPTEVLGLRWSDVDWAVDHWSKALEPAPAVAPITNPARPIAKNQKTEKPCVLQGLDGSWGGSDDPKNRPSRARTYDLRIRNPLLCPTEL